VASIVQRFLTEIHRLFYLFIYYSISNRFQLEICGLRTYRGPHAVTFILQMQMDIDLLHLEVTTRGHSLKGGFHVCIHVYIYVVIHIFSCALCVTYLRAIEQCWRFLYVGFVAVQTPRYNGDKRVHSDTKKTSANVVTFWHDCEKQDIHTMY
jgi:hypothetical protein